MAIVAVMLVVGFSAFKVVENSSTTPQNGWYEIFLTNNSFPQYDDPDNQKIVDHQSAGPDGALCNVVHTEEPCMVNLIFPENYEGPEGEELKNTTVDELINLHGVTYGSPQYARSDF